MCSENMAIANARVVSCQNHGGVEDILGNRRNRGDRRGGNTGRWKRETAEMLGEDWS